ncbi:hypothetical protein [Polyangium spumosum]|uniref:Uncharacterized protein n=1 Tax=Polyangium spumosum TaxID=889282 RepID=A0A6N7PNF3_9BACT|nr:hypothetical protein [Polyangium spumosum]MRG91655.1 hypothetical protein [Polyangium spumosum]
MACRFVHCSDGRIYLPHVPGKRERRFFHGVELHWEELARLSSPTILRLLVWGLLAFGHDGIIYIWETEVHGTEGRRYFLGYEATPEEAAEHKRDAAEAGFSYERFTLGRRHPASLQTTNGAEREPSSRRDTKGGRMGRYLSHWERSRLWEIVYKLLCDHHGDAAALATVLGIPEAELRVFLFHYPGKRTRWALVVRVARALDVHPRALLRRSTDPRRCPLCRTLTRRA